MITFIVALLVLVGGYFIYGSFVERVFGPDRNRRTPPEGLALSAHISYILGGACTLTAAIRFAAWYKKQNSIVYEKI